MKQNIIIVIRRPYAILIINIVFRERRQRQVRYFHGSFKLYLVRTPRELTSNSMIFQCPRRFECRILISEIWYRTYRVPISSM